jgi:ArsR family transcriptional regulator, arsenate/arsenite/antimonite-responsive transcriptional repressor
MVASKKELFDEVLQQQADLFKMLGHPARLQIIRFLASTRTCYSGDLSEELPLGRTTVNQHLKELKNAGIIRGQVGGSKRNYCLDLEKVEEMRKIVKGFLEEYEQPEQFCCRK